MRTLSVLPFNEAVVPGSGSIVIYNSNGTIAKRIAVTDTSQVTFSGNTVTVNPSTDLAAGRSYKSADRAGGTLIHDRPQQLQCSDEGSGVAGTDHRGELRAEHSM